MFCRCEDFIAPRGARTHACRVDTRVDAWRHLALVAALPCCGQAPSPACDPLVALLPLPEIAEGGRHVLPPAGHCRQDTSPRDRDLHSSVRSLLPRPGWQILLEETVAQRIQVYRVGTLHAMAAVRVLHEMELLVERDQPIEQPLCSLEMHVVVACAMEIGRASC